MTATIVIENKHRLPPEFYKGIISVSFTLSLRGDVGKKYALAESEIVKTFTDILRAVSTKEGGIIPIYCFMPDHQHLIISGRRNDSKVWKSVVSYKQKTGFWFSKNKPEMKWQKDFYDHIIRTDENVAVQVKYILDNPIRKGLVSEWREYPYCGSIGCKMEDVLIGIM
jgi:REP element-mobilizing transposase RayT